MCTNKKWINPKGANHPVLVPCGHCKSCMQQKANRRAKKIKAHRPTGFTCYFVTLTYRNELCPYINPTELQIALNGSGEIKLPVYGYSVLAARSLKNHNLVPQPSKIDEIIIDPKSADYLRHLPESAKNLKKLRKYDKTTRQFTYLEHKIGVAYYKDLPLFIKRLRISYKRQFGKILPLSYYGVSEYGTISCRPHLHALIWVPSELQHKVFAELVDQAWPYAAISFKSERTVEVAISPANYLAAYVNNSDSCPRLLTAIKPTKTSHSLGFGLSDFDFTPRSVIQSFREQRNTRYLRTVLDKNGQMSMVSLPYPNYIKNRYFPKIKGFNYFSTFELYSIYSQPELLRLNPFKGFNRVDVKTGEMVTMYELQPQPNSPETTYMSHKELLYFFNKLNNTFNLFYKPLGIDRFEFARIVVDFYHREKSDNIKFGISQCKTPDQVFYYYDNIAEIYNKRRVKNPLHLIAPNLIDFFDKFHFDIYDSSLKLDPNEFPENVLLTNQLTLQYDQNIKHRNLQQISKKE